MNIMKYMNDLSNRQKVRIISLFIISILLFLRVSGYISEIQNADNEIDYVEELPVDGEDFSPIANLFILGTNGILQLITIALTYVAMVNISLILLVPWRLIAIRKNSEISKKELDMAKGILKIFVVITPVTGFAMTHFTYVFSIVFLTLIPAAFLLVLGVLPLRNAYKHRDGQVLLKSNSTYQD